MINAILIGFGVIAIAIGAALYAAQLRQGLRANASKRWPVSPGTVTASALEKSPQGRWRYRAAVQYRYRVGGKDYQSNRIFWGGNEGSRKHMELVIAAYPQGSKVSVHYDPQNPAEAVIDPAQNAGSKPLVLYAVAMVALGLFVLFLGAYALLH
jgi:uncharacterized protein DUF3592